MSLAEELLADLEDSEDEEQVEDEAEVADDDGATAVGAADVEMELTTEPVAATAAGQSLQQVAKLFTRYVNHLPFLPSSS